MKHRQNRKKFPKTGRFFRLSGGEKERERERERKRERERERMSVLVFLYVFKMASIPSNLKRSKNLSNGFEMDKIYLKKLTAVV